MSSEMVPLEARLGRHSSGMLLFFCLSAAPTCEQSYYLNYVLFVGDNEWNRIRLARHGLVLQKRSEKNKSLSRAMKRNLVSCSCNCHKRQPFVNLAPATNLYTDEETL